MDENQVTDSGGTGLLANLILKIIPATSANFTVATLASTSDSFYLAEHIFHVSEIIAVLIATLAAKDAYGDYGCFCYALNCQLCVHWLWSVCVNKPV